MKLLENLHCWKRFSFLCQFLWVFCHFPPVGISAYQQDLWYSKSICSFFPYSQLEDINVPLWHNKHVQGSNYNHKASNRLYLEVRNNRQEQMSIDFISMQMFFIINKGRELHKMWCICPKVTLNGMIFWSFSCVIGGSLQYKSLTINSVHGI